LFKTAGRTQRGTQAMRRVEKSAKPKMGERRENHQAILPPTADFASPLPYERD